jgi:hypothetical protein
VVPVPVAVEAVDALADADPVADVLPVPAAEVPQAASTSTQTRRTVRRTVGPRIRVAARGSQPTGDKDRRSG